MISLFLSFLSISSMTINGGNVTLTPHYSNDNSVMYYEFAGDDSDPVNGDIVSINTSQGNITFKILYNYRDIGNYHSYDLQFQVYGDSYYSNLYIYNLEAEVNEDTQPSYTYALPNVYFLGQTNYYVDNEDGNYTIQYADTGHSSNIYLSFDIGILPSSFVDGSTYQNGYTDGYNAGYGTGVDDGITIGYNGGYVDGYDNASTQNQTAVTIFSGIISVGLIPINFFLACLNFEVFGINIGSFVSALLTIAIVVIITRMIISGGNGGGDK